MRIHLKHWLAIEALVIGLLYLFFLPGLADSDAEVPVLLYQFLFVMFCVTSVLLVIVDLDGLLKEAWLKQYEQKQAEKDQTRRRARLSDEARARRVESLSNGTALVFLDDEMRVYHADERLISISYETILFWAANIQALKQD